MNTRSYSKVSNHSVKRQQRYNPYPLNRRTSFTENHFQIWKNRINNYVYQRIGWNLDDLPDQPYRLWFDDGQQLIHIEDDRDGDGDFESHLLLDGEQSSNSPPHESVMEN